MVLTGAGKNFCSGEGLGQACGRCHSSHDGHVTPVLMSVTVCSPHLPLGLDLGDAAELFMNVPGSDTARKAKFLYEFTKRFQEALTSVERCPQPVIAAVHSACVGGGEDLCVVCWMPVCVRVCVCCMFIPHKPPGYFLLCFSLSPSSPIPSSPLPVPLPSPPPLPPLPSL